MTFKYATAFVIVVINILTGYSADVQSCLLFEDLFANALVTHHRLERLDAFSRRLNGGMVQKRHRLVVRLERLKERSQSVLADCIKDLQKEIAIVENQSKQIRNIDNLLGSNFCLSGTRLKFNTQKELKRLNELLDRYIGIQESRFPTQY